MIFELPGRFSLLEVNKNFLFVNFRIPPLLGYKGSVFPLNKKFASFSRKARETVLEMHTACR